MANVTTRQELIDYCLRQLGEPVIEINIDPDQLEDRVDEALQFYQEYHSDAVKKMFIPHQITASDIINKFVTVPEQVIFVERILPVGDSQINMFNVKYQLHLNDVYHLNNLGNLAYYEQVQQNLAMYDMKLGTGASELVRFSRHERKVYLDIDKEDLVEDNYIIVVGHATLDPESTTRVYNDMFLKQYTTALIKKQWGANLIKFEGMQLPGGVMLNGRQLYEDAMQDIERLEEQIRLTHELPVNFFMG